jgi:hypothetical protein
MTVVVGELVRIAVEAVHGDDAGDRDDHQAEAQRAEGAGEPGSERKVADGGHGRELLASMWVRSSSAPRRMRRIPDLT